MYKYCLLCLLPVLFCTFCKNDHDVMTRLASAEQTMQERSDSALVILTNIDPNIIAYRKSKAKYALLYSQALDKNGIDVKSDSLIRKAVSYYSRHGSKKDRGASLYYLARVYENMGDIENAIQSYIASEDDLVCTKDRKLLGMLYANMGNLYVRQNSFEDAARMYDKAIEIYHDFKTINEIYALFGKAGMLRVQTKYEEALAVLDVAQTLALEYGYPDCIFELIIYKAAILSDMEQSVENSTRIIRLLIDACNEYNNGCLHEELYPLMGICYYHIGALDSAKYYAHLALEHCGAEATTKNAGLYLISAQIHEAIGDFAMANQYLYHHIDLVDKQTEEEKQHLIQDLEQKYRTEQIRQSYVVLKNKSIIWMVIGFLTLTIVGCISWIIYKRKQEQIEEIFGFVSALKNDYSSLQKKYSNLNMELGQLNDKSRRLLTVLDNRMKSLRHIVEMAGAFESSPAVFYEKFRKYIHVESSGFKNGLAFDDLYDIINLYYGDIVSRLQQHYPSLNDEDLALCGMIYLGFTPQQTRLLFNHTNSSSIYTKRSKLRKKLGLSEDTDNLEIFLFDFLKHPMELG